MTICAAFALAACGGGSSTASDEGSTAKEQASTEAGSRSDGSSGSEISSEAPRPTKPPKVSVPPGPPPKHIVVKDLREGTGAVLKWGKELSVRYVAVDYKTGKVIENRWGDRFEWAYGPGSVVKAWVKGLRGMKVGGVRKLIAPSRLAYGEGAMIWVVELLSVTDEFSG
jgi:peptidylprolyl isomerase